MSNSCDKICCHVQYNNPNVTYKFCWYSSNKIHNCFPNISEVFYSNAGKLLFQTFIIINRCLALIITFKPVIYLCLDTTLSLNVYNNILCFCSHFTMFKTELGTDKLSSQISNCKIKHDNGKLPPNKHICLASNLPEYYTAISRI